MEYIIGSATTLLSVLVLGFLLSRDKMIGGLFVPVTYRQSHIHELIKDVIPLDIPRQKKDRQSTKHEIKTNVKVIIIDNQAYWVKDNTFYVADFNEDTIDKDTVRVVDTLSMDKVQLDKMFFIMDQLKDGEE